MTLPLYREGMEPSPRELEILRLVAMGLTRQAIADELGIAHKTVVNHLDHLYMRLGAHSSHEAMWKLGWVRPHHETAQSRDGA